MVQGRRTFMKLLVFLPIFIATLMLVAGTSNAEDAKVTKAMADVKVWLKKIGEPKVDGKDLYFGHQKMNNNSHIVDVLAEKVGMETTLFVKEGDEFIRIATTIPNQDGSGRAVGTTLVGPALEALNAGAAYYGEVSVLGAPYISGYEPIKDASRTVIGAYFVGYKK